MDCVAIHAAYDVEAETSRRQCCIHSIGCSFCETASPV